MSYFILLHVILSLMNFIAQINICIVEETKISGEYYGVFDVRLRQFVRYWQNLLKLF